VIYLIGANDVSRGDLNYGFDNRLLKNSYTNWLDFASKKSELVNFLVNVARSLKAKKYGVGHGNIDLRKMEVMELDNYLVSKELDKHKLFIDGFYKRLSKLIKTTKDNQMEPVLMTQPLLWGQGVDPSTGVNLENVKIDQLKNGKLDWQILELYNEKTREVAKEYGVLLIDLARILPKDSRYFYDGSHYTNEGATAVANIVNEELIKYLK
jgi:hypothetical protein